MADEIPISLAVEDELSEQMLRVLIAQTNRPFLVGFVYGKKGNAYLKQRLKAFNNASKGCAHLLLTDLDSNPCASELIEDWFSCKIAKLNHYRHHNLLFRIAVKEIESWVMADRTHFARFLGMRVSQIPNQTDALLDPKASLLEYAAASNNRELREDLVREIDGHKKIGPDYNGRLTEFLHKNWRVVNALPHSPSLNRAWNALNTFRPIYTKMSNHLS